MYILPVYAYLTVQEETRNMKAFYIYKVLSFKCYDSFPLNKHIVNIHRKIVYDIYCFFIIISILILDIIHLNPQQCLLS